jgi:DNA-binding transcriptional ArsR family regulator
MRTKVGAMPVPEPDDPARPGRTQARGVAKALDEANAQLERATERAAKAVDQARRAVQKVVVADPRGIRALAHPARMEAIDRLYAGEIMTATELASAADVSPSAMSYHLRELAKWGVIERVDDGSDGRERRWRAAGSDLQIGAKDGSGKSTAGRAAHMALSRQIMERTEAAIEQHMRRGDEEPEEWRASLEMNTQDLLLGKDEMHQLGERMRELLEPYSTRRSDPPEDARSVRVLTVIVPTK